MRAPGSRGAIAVLALAACDNPFFAVYDAGTITAEDAGVPVSPCRELQAETYVLEAPGEATIALAIDAASVLVGTRGDSPGWYLVTRSGPARLAATTPGLLPLSGAMRGDELWLGGYVRSLAHGSFDPAAGFSLADDPRPPEPLRWIAVSPAEQSFALYGIGELRGEGGLHYFDGSTWSLLWPRATPYVRDETDYGGIAWASEEEVFAVPRGSQCNTLLRCVLRHDRSTGVVTEEPADTVEPITAITYVPGFGPVAGNRWGELFRRAEGGWTMIPGAPPLETFYPARIARVILPYGGGAIYFSDRRVTQWYPDFGYCPDPLPFGDALRFLYQAAPLEDGFVLVGGVEDNAPLAIVTVFPRR